MRTCRAFLVILLAPALRAWAPLRVPRGPAAPAAGRRPSGRAADPFAGRAAGPTLLAASAGEGNIEYELELFSPAKINLFLRILGKREDGFHELASLFQAIDLGDTLAFGRLPDGGAAEGEPAALAAEGAAFECASPGVPRDGTNLVLRAFAAFRAGTGLDARFACRLDKTTPIQAGLGGGSSNAATALFAANELCGRPASPAQLIEWSKDLGSDVTFFLGDTGSAYCTGRGEDVAAVPALADTDLYVIKPSQGLSTPRVFKTLAQSEYATLSSVPPTELLELFSTPSPAGPDAYINDLEPPAFACEPALGEIKAALLSRGFGAAMMSGSGTSLFAVGAPPGLGDDFGASFEAEMAAAGVTCTVYRSRFLARNGAAGRWYCQ